MKIYDCFTFYNELDLLEIRLDLLYNTVDHFVIVESNQTFTNRAKPFLFEENKQRYSKYMDKIIHVKVTDMPGDLDPWVNEIHQRNAIVRGVVEAEHQDIIIISDCDEIPRPEAIELMRINSAQAFALRMPLFNFKFNYMRVTPGEYDFWAMATRKWLLGQFSPDHVRSRRHHMPNEYFAEIIHGGWHFGYLGNNDYLRDKAQSFSHQEVNTLEFLEHIDIDKSIAERKEWNRSAPNHYKIVELNDYFPKSLLNYPQFILDNPEANAYNLLPPFPYK